MVKLPRAEASRQAKKLAKGISRAYGYHLRCRFACWVTKPLLMLIVDCANVDVVCCLDVQSATERMDLVSIIRVVLILETTHAKENLSIGAKRLWRKVYRGRRR